MIHFKIRIFNLLFIKSLIFLLLFNLFLKSTLQASDTNLGELVVEIRSFTKDDLLDYTVLNNEFLPLQENLFTENCISEIVANNIAPIKILKESLEPNEETVFCIVYEPADLELPYIASRFPLAYGEPDSWGPASFEEYDEFQEYWEDCFAKISSRVQLLDLTYSRLPKQYYWTFERLENLVVLKLPYGGFDFSNEHFSFPLNIKEITVYNSAIDRNFHIKLQNLSQLKKITFIGCWLDEKIDCPSFLHPNYVAVNSPISLSSSNNGYVHPFKNIHKSITEINFVDCDTKLPRMMSYYTWLSLRSIKIFRSFNDLNYLDMLAEISYLNVGWINGKVFNRMKNIEKITYGVNNLNQELVRTDSSGVSRKSNMYEQIHFIFQNTFDNYKLIFRSQPSKTNHSTN